MSKKCREYSLEQSGHQWNKHTCDREEGHEGPHKQQPFAVGAVSIIWDDKMWIRAQLTDIEEGGGVRQGREEGCTIAMVPPGRLIGVGGSLPYKEDVDGMYRALVKHFEGFRSTKEQVCLRSRSKVEWNALHVENGIRNKSISEDRIKQISNFVSHFRDVEKEPT